MTGLDHFYHSFPRQRLGVDPIGQGLNIIDSVCRFGLILTPETVEWRESLTDGSLSEPYIASQERFCVTELKPTELRDHAKQFNAPFAFEFSVEKLRALGAMPVLYLPRAAEHRKGLDGVGSTLMARLAEVQLTLERIEVLRKACPQHGGDETIQATFRSGGQTWCSDTRATFGGAADLVDRVILHETQPINKLLGALRGVASLFYPLDDDHTEGAASLAYYRQREWRLIAAVLSNLNADALSRPTPEEAASLIKSSEWFGRMIPLRSGNFCRAERCWILRRNLDGEHITKSIERVLVPKGQRGAVEELCSGKLRVEEVDWP